MKHIKIHAPLTPARFARLMSRAAGARRTMMQYVASANALSSIQAFDAAHEDFTKAEKARAWHVFYNNVAEKSYGLAFEGMMAMTTEYIKLRRNAAR